MSQIGKRLCLVMNPGLFGGHMITVYGCGEALQDNARPHTARVAQDYLCHFSDSSMAGPLPDLSPVEPVWDQIKWQMPLCNSVHDLELAAQDLWVHHPQDIIRCLIN
ncbi:DDE_3 domain-containing protein [Trichonephila clavipes]|uniref:DDE_3 domain-containing protein n=1 Tax=Trichonephila clavipes TaxID=2585209 RepID=A0A8X6VIJ6_TRICX|nr:DDE_3 domain-containing protein [Trichonephila clavipes]